MKIKFILLGFLMWGLLICPQTLAADSMNAKSECQRLVDEILPLVGKILGEYGEFYPVSAVIRKDGKVRHVAVSDGNENPASEAVIDQLNDQLRKLAKDQEITASAIAYNAKVVPPGTMEKTDAVVIALDHEASYSVIVSFPYAMNPQKQVFFGSPFAVHGDAAIFEARQ